MKTKRLMPELSSGAMADIAFLLLTFFMVTTQINEYKGLALSLPPYLYTNPIIDVNDRNMFSIRINSNDQFLIEGEITPSIEGLRIRMKDFILNNKRNPNLSDSPEKAVISIKADRGTTHKTFLAALDEAQAAYYEIYGERVGLTANAFRALDVLNPESKKVYEKAREGIPMNISIAEPTTAQID
jgi:biopolymer transport protein ExbD